MNESNDLFGEDDVIFRYTRAQALADGVLVDLTEWAQETGFRIPVACTAAVWHEWITPPEAMRSHGQSERGRAHDVLWMLFVAIRQGQGGDRVLYDVLFQQQPGQTLTARLKAICGPGDEGEPVVTIMLPDED